MSAGPASPRADGAAVLPLAGLKVVEMTHMVMGPTCGMILADLGADVVKVEPLRGDRTRELHGMAESFFPFFSRNKRSLAVDLETEEGRAIVAGLVEGADVFVENFRDGALDKVGLGYATLSARHPRLVHCAMKGFLSGPYANRPALDEVVQMMAGLGYMTGSFERPLRVGSSVNDIMGGMFGVIAILAALREREATGRGREIRVGLFENCLMLVGQHMVQYDLTGEAAPPMSERRQAWAVYDIFDTADRGRVFVAVVTDGHWASFCERFGLGDLRGHPDLATNASRIDARPWLIPRIAAILAGYEAADLRQRLEGCGIPFAEIKRPEELFEDPHVLHPGALIAGRDPKGRAFRSPALPIEFGRERPGRASPPPVLGNATRDLLAEAGYGEAEIERLVAAGIVGAPPLSIPDDPSS